MSRSFLLLVLAATLAFSAPAASAAPAWPQATSDLKADPSVRFGILANGMRYAVMRNATPAGETSVRLRIGSGSLEESDDQQGLAHFMEHMAFRGSTHVPQGEMMKILERDGLAFGPDTNASTGWSQTVFQLDLPRSSSDMLDTGLMLMRETASEALIDPKALEVERGVVLSEERLRDTPDYRAEKAQIDLFAHGQLATRRFPIGLVSVIEHAPASLVRKYYEANYRPDRATLIVVGDVDPALVEAKIKAKFASWTPIGPPTAEPDLGQVDKRGLTVTVTKVPGSQTETDIAWARPYDDSPDTIAKRRREIVENLALAVLNRRLSNLALGADPPFISAESAFENLLHSDKIAIIDASSNTGAWRPALTTIEQEVRRLVTFGVSKSELDREIVQSRAALVNAAAGESTRPTPELASAMVDSVDESLVFTNPSEDLAVFDQAVKAISPEEVDAAARAVFAGSGPLVDLVTPTPIVGGEQAVAEAYAASQATPVSAPAAEAALVWPYANFGPPGKVTSRRQIGDLGVTQVRFANGVTLSIKPTDFRKDQVLVSVDLGYGRVGMPTDRPDAGWAVAALPDSGFKAMSLEDSQRVLTGRIYSAEAAVGDNTFTLRGATRPADLATQMQVLAAYVADPGFRPQAFERLRRAYSAFLPQLEATPGGVVRRDFENLIHDGDPRWATPTEAELSDAKSTDLAGLLAEPLSRAPIEVTIVGNVSVDDTIREVAATFGALPPRGSESRPPRAGLTTRFPPPAAAPVTRSDSGRPDQAMAIMAWPVTDFFTDMQGSRATMLAGEVLGNRIVDKVRVSEGATYSPETEVSLSETFPGYGVAYVAVEIPPQKIEGFFNDVSAIIADMAAHGVTADELERARNPRVASISKSLSTNEYWLYRLDGSIADPRRLAIIRTTLPDYAAVTTAAVQGAVKRYFTSAAAWKMIVRAPVVHP